MPAAEAIKPREREGRPGRGPRSPLFRGPTAPPASRLNGCSLENDAFSDKSERENADESDSEAQDLGQKTAESGGDPPEPLGQPGHRGTTYVQQCLEELGEVRVPAAWSPGCRLPPPLPRAEAAPPGHGREGPEGVG